MTYRLILALFGTMILASCDKTVNPAPGDGQAFTFTFNSAYSIVQYETAGFLSDEDGQVRVFQWLSGPGTTKLTVPDAKAGERFDFTLVGIHTLALPGTGVIDTFLTMRTYTHLANGAELDLIPVNNEIETLFQIKFNGISTLDSIVVPNGVTFELPQFDNGFQGQYLVRHNGQFWFRIKINAEPKWRYLIFDNVASSLLNITRDATTMPELPASSFSIGLPFFAGWSYRMDRAIDAGQNNLLTLAPQLPIPGGVMPLFDEIPVLEPAGLPNNGYRLWLMGNDAAPGGYGYECDRFFSTLPNVAPALNFDIQPTSLADKRLIAVTSSGPVDVLSFMRSAVPNNMTWEVLTAPAATGPTVYRLPDVPVELSSLFPALMTYDFGSEVQVRAERYDLFDNYDAAIKVQMHPLDPLWRAKAGYVARRRTF